MKRMADQVVLRGHDLQTAEALFDFLSSKDEMKIQIKWIEEKDIAEFDTLLPPVLPVVKGILGTHQIFTTTPGKIFHREVSCFCNYPKVCDCFNVKQVTMTTDSPGQEVSTVPPCQDEDDEGDQVSSSIITYFIPWRGRATQITCLSIVECIAQLWSSLLELSYRIQYLIMGNAFIPKVFKKHS